MTVNPWILHCKKVSAKHPHLTWSEVLVKAKGSYVKGMRGRGPCCSKDTVRVGPFRMTQEEVDHVKSSTTPSQREQIKQIGAEFIAQPRNRLVGQKTLNNLSKTVQKVAHVDKATSDTSANIFAEMADRAQKKS